MPTTNQQPPTTNFAFRASLRRRFESWVRPRAPEPLPVAIDRRRVYVIPTGFGLFFAIVLGAMGLGALNDNNNPAWLTPAGLLLLSTLKPFALEQGYP